MLPFSSSDILTWTLTGCVMLLAYLLGAAHSRGALGAGEFSKPCAPQANAAPSGGSGEGEEADSLATVRTKTLANQSYLGRVDGDRAPQTPARSLAPSLGNLHESEEHSDDGEVGSRIERRAPENVRVETAESGEAGEAGDETSTDATAAGAHLDQLTQAVDTKVSFVRRKIVPKQLREFAVVHFRDDSQVTAEEESVDKGANVLKLETSEVERKRQETASKEKKARLVGAMKPETAVRLPRTMRMTSDGIPVVDVSRGSSGSGGLVASGGSTEKVKEAWPRSESGNMPTVTKKSPLRTTSNPSERERVSVLYKSPSSPLSPKAQHYTPRWNNQPTSPKADGGGLTPTGGRMGGAGGAVSGPGQQMYQHSNVERQKSGRWANHLNQASQVHAQSGGTSGATDTSPISTISSVSSRLLPSHRRNESENTKLEGAWMVASMAAAELGIGGSDHPTGGQEDRITMASNADSVSPWAMSWSNPVDRPDSMLGGSNSFNSGSSSLPTATTDCSDRSNHGDANRGLDLYSSLSSLSSLSWANSNSLSSYGSSLHRSSMSDRPDVFNTIKGIWGEKSEPDQEKLS
jgi:hypothetical protein